jgi:hypothetical protein
MGLQILPSGGSSTITFSGYQGTLQKIKPIFDTFTSLGSDKLYVQRVKSESQESKIKVWNVYLDAAVADTDEDSLKSALGIRSVMQFDSDPQINCIILDYTSSRKKGAGNRWLVEYELTIRQDNGGTI